MVCWETPSETNNAGNSDNISVTNWYGIQKKKKKTYRLKWKESGWRGLLYWVRLWRQWKQKTVSREMASINKRLNRNCLTKVTEHKPITWEQQRTKGTSLLPLPRLVFQGCCFPLTPRVPPESIEPQVTQGQKKGMVERHWLFEKCLPTSGYT